MNKSLILPLDIPKAMLPMAEEFLVEHRCIVIHHRQCLFRSRSFAVLPEGSVLTRLGAILPDGCTLSSQPSAFSVFIGTKEVGDEH